jgi:hypothetical protein
LELARHLVESVIVPAALKEEIAERVRRIEDIATRWVQGLTEEQNRAGGNADPDGAD